MQRTVGLFAQPTFQMFHALVLLPIWKRLPQESSRVYRLQTDEGERIIGRRVSPAWAANASASGVTSSLTPDAAYAALIEGRTILDLAEGLQLRRVRVMGASLRINGVDCPALITQLPEEAGFTEYAGGAAASALRFGAAAPLGERAPG